ncbi:MAG: hypothetical protein HQL16_08335, partial [Candidatus Omnitrophica bacterium]|nr:hypothetical protein [Candidatus Omnitrophota bacterium]
TLKNSGAIKRLKGCVLGKVSTSGELRFSPVKNFRYAWPVLGRHKEGWKVKIAYAGEQHGEVWVEVILRKKGREEKRNFVLVWGKELLGRHQDKGKTRTVWRLVPKELAVQLARYQQSQGAYDTRLEAFEIDAGNDVEQRIEYGELVQFLLTRWSPWERKIVESIIDGHDDASIIEEGHDQKKVDAVREGLQTRARQWLEQSRDYARVRGEWDPALEQTWAEILARVDTTALEDDEQFGAQKSAALAVVPPLVAETLRMARVVKAPEWLVRKKKAIEARAREKNPEFEILGANIKLLRGGIIFIFTPQDAVRTLVHEGYALLGGESHEAYEAKTQRLFSQEHIRFLIRDYIYGRREHLRDIARYGLLGAAEGDEMILRQLLVAAQSAVPELSGASDRWAELYIELTAILIWRHDKAVIDSFENIVRKFKTIESVSVRCRFLETLSYMIASAEPALITSAHLSAAHEAYIQAKTVRESELLALMLFKAFERAPASSLRPMHRDFFETFLEAAIQEKEFLTAVYLWAGLDAFDREKAKFQADKEWLISQSSDRAGVDAFFKEMAQRILAEAAPAALRWLRRLNHHLPAIYDEALSVRLTDILLDEVFKFPYVRQKEVFVLLLGKMDALAREGVLNPNFLIMLLLAVSRQEPEIRNAVKEVLQSVRVHTPFDMAAILRKRILLSPRAVPDKGMDIQALAMGGFRDELSLLLNRVESDDQNLWDLIVREIQNMNPPATGHDPARTQKPLTPRARKDLEDIVAGIDSEALKISKVYEAEKETLIASLNPQTDAQVIAWLRTNVVFQAPRNLGERLKAFEKKHNNLVYALNLPSNAILVLKRKDPLNSIVHEAAALAGKSHEESEAVAEKYAPSSRDMEWLLTQPEDADWDALERSGELARLNGLEVGKTSPNGLLRFFFNSFRYSWAVMGHPKRGWKVKLTNVVSRQGRVRLDVVLTKGRRMEKRSFVLVWGHVMPGIEREKGNNKTVWNLEDAQDALGEGFSHVLTQKQDVDWAAFEQAGGFDRLREGGIVGKLNSHLHIKISVMPYFSYEWHPGAEFRGSEIFVKEAGVQGGQAWIKFVFKKNGREKTRKYILVWGRTISGTEQVQGEKRVF